MWTNFPNGISVTTATGSAAGVIEGTSGKVYGGRVSLAFAGSAAPSVYQAAITSALYDSGATIRAPFKAVAEIIWVTLGTANVTPLITVHAGSVSTAAVVATLTESSAVTAATTTYTTIGAVAIGQGSFIHISSAVQATANSSHIMVNLIPVA